MRENNNINIHKDEKENTQNVKFYYELSAILTGIVAAPQSREKTNLFRKRHTKGGGTRRSETSKYALVKVAMLADYSGKYRIQQQNEPNFRNEGAEEKVDGYSGRSGE